MAHVLKGSQVFCTPCIYLR